jgi:hypothetical protein
MASNPVFTGSSIDRVKDTLKTVTDASLFIEQMLGGLGVGGNLQGIERLTAAFQSLASTAIQAAHTVAGQPITPESVMALMPVNTPLQPSQPGADGPAAK